MAQDEAGARPPSGPEWEYELRMPDGRLAGLLHVYELQALLYAGKLPQGSLVRRPAPGPAWPADTGDSGAWKGPWTLPALRSVYELLGIEYDRPEGERRIAGWQRSDDAEADDDLSHPSVTMAEPPVSTPATSERNNLVPLIVGTVLLVLVLLVVGLVLAS